MSWCDVPLKERPQLVQIARASHGILPVQDWVIEGFWGFHLYDYSASVWIDGQETAIEPGFCGFTPPGAVARYRFKGPSTHLYAHVRWQSGDTERLPLTFAVGRSFRQLWLAMDEAVGFFSTQRVRAEVRVWDTILSAAAAREEGDRGMPASVRQVLAAIDQRLGEPLSVQALAREVFLSHNQLTRVFRHATGTTVIEAIQERRMERARHLLRHSTMPIKQVATLVGIPDLQRFNKAVRKRYGASPSSVRESH